MTALDLGAVKARYRAGSADSPADLPTLIAAVERVESLCRSYAAGPPPIFRGPGLSEFGHGNNHGTKTLAQAVLAELRGEESEGDE